MLIGSSNTIALHVSLGSFETRATHFLLRWCCSALSNIGRRPRFALGNWFFNQPSALIENVPADLPRSTKLARPARRHRSDKVVGRKCQGSRWHFSSSAFVVVRNQRTLRRRICCHNFHSVTTSILPSHRKDVWGEGQ